MSVVRSLHSPALPTSSRSFSLDKAPVWLSCLLLAAAVIVPTYDFRANASAEFSLDTQLMIRLAICGACGLYGLVYGRSAQSFLLQFPGAWVLVFCVWATCTIPFALSPSYTAAACIALWCMALFIPAVLDQLGERRVLATLFISLSCFIALAWFLYLFVPSIGRSEYLVGEDAQYRVGSDAQQLGLQSMWLIGVALAMKVRREIGTRWLVVAIVGGLITIAFAQSRTSLAAAMAIIALTLVTQAPRKNVLILATMGLIALTGVCWAYSIGAFEVHEQEVLQSVSRTGTQREIFNITGRTEFWPYVMDQIARSPIWGYGYGGSRQALQEFHGGSFGYSELHHAHNAILNLVLTTGLVGGLIFVAMLLSMLNGLLKKRALFPSIVLVALLICGLTESVIFGPMPRSHTLLLVMALYWNQSQASNETSLNTDHGAAVS